MERNFLGISGKELAAAAKEDASRGSPNDAGFLGGSAVQWPFSNKVSALQQFMTFKAAQEERPKKIVFDQLSSSGFQSVATVDAFDSNHRSSSVLMPQNNFGVDRQGIHQFQLPGYPTQGTDHFGVSGHQSNELRTFPMVSHHAIPIATSSPFFKLNGSANGSNTGATSLKQQQPFGGGAMVAPPGVSSMAGAFAPRNMIKPLAPTAQLTIFYAGTVNVFDDIPVEKAQAIMFLAANGSNLTSNAGNIRAQTPVSVPNKVAGNEAITMNQTQMQINVTPPCIVMSSPMSTTCHSGAQSGSGSSATEDLSGGKTIGSLVPTNQHEPPKPIAATAVASAAGATLMPRAVPQARKASLARFLEKRKERVTNIAAPYPLTPKSAESGAGCDGKSTIVEMARSSSKEQSWCLGTQKNSTDNTNSLGTKLEI